MVYKNGVLVACVHEEQQTRKYNIPPHLLSGEKSDRFEFKRLLPPKDIEIE